MEQVQSVGAVVHKENSFVVEKSEAEQSAGARRASSIVDQLDRYLRVFGDAGRVRTAVQV